MTKILWMLTIIGGIAGILLVFSSFAMSGAPQQGAAAAIGIGFGVLPYCIARAWSEMRGKNRQVGIKE